MQERDMVKAMLIQEMERWLSTPDAASRLGMSRQAVWKAAKAGRLLSAQTANGLLLDPASVEAYQRRGTKRTRSGGEGDG